MSEHKGDSIQSVYLKLLETQEYADVLFQIGPEKEEVKAHKLFLVSRSLVFKAMLSECWQDLNNAATEGIEIPHTELDTLRSFLKVK